MSPSGLFLDLELATVSVTFFTVGGRSLELFLSIILLLLPPLLLLSPLLSLPPAATMNTYRFIVDILLLLLSPSFSSSSSLRWVARASPSYWLLQYLGARRATRWVGRTKHSAVHSDRGSLGRRLRLRLETPSHFHTVLLDRVRPLSSPKLSPRSQP